MAKLVESVLVIKASKLIRDDQEAGDIINDETKVALEAVVQELVGESVLVEVEKA